MLFQHSMVYFFHHYELPAILQQARIQHLLAHGGGVRNQASASTANQNASTQNQATDATPTVNTPANQETVTEVIQNGQIPNQNQNSVQVNADSVLAEGDLIDLQTNNVAEGQQVLGDLELSAILHDTLNQTLNVEIDEAMQNEDSEDEYLPDLVDLNIDQSEVDNNSPHSVDCVLENSTQNTALGTRSSGAVSSNQENLSAEASCCDSENSFSKIPEDTIQRDRDSAISSDSSTPGAERDHVRYRGHREVTPGVSGDVSQSRTEDSGSEV